MRCRLKRSLESSVYLSSERLDGITKEGVIMRGTWLNTTLLAGLIPNLGSDFFMALRFHLIYNLWTQLGTYIFSSLKETIWP